MSPYVWTAAGTKLLRPISVIPAEYTFLPKGF
jgi:hypothetical protein